ncbi:MAG: T9SS type A sorting domain-containing protein [Sphingobacteriales bacterium JAD_PAG50586_3]|nr:MAG: T9SS type A sorting domain-containing protein [Sphingobacteriales bacterium JAD_PAG50586_3]
MLKKLLSVAAVVAISFAANAQAPCTPDPIYADSSAGIWPDSATGLPIGYTGDPNGYAAVIQVKTLSDTSVNFQGIPVQLFVQRLKVLDVVGEPDGFVVAPAYNGLGGYWQNGGTDPNWTEVQGCVLISAPQSAVIAAQAVQGGVYPITVWVDVYAKGNPIPATYTWVSSLGTPPYGSAIAYDDYVLRIQQGVGVIENALDANKFNVAPNFPNPFSNITNINYNTVKEENINFNVYNTVGALVYSNKYQSTAGKNTIVFDGTKLSAGMYIYTVSNGKETFTRKMTIN